MRKIFFAIFLCASGSLFSHDYWCLNKRLSLSGEYGYYRRQEIRNLPLVIEGSLDKAILKTDKLVDQFDWDRAIGGKAVFHIDACSSLEVLYTDFHKWEGEAKVKGDALFFPFEEITFDSDYFEAQRAKGVYRSRLRGGEANYWGHITPQRVDYFSFSSLLGFRALRLREFFGLTFFKGTDASDYTIHTKNYLYGVQLGAMLQINPNCHFTWTFMVKGAGLLNDCENRLLILDQNNTEVFREYRRSRYVGSLLLEGLGQLDWHVFSWLSVYFSYRGFIVTGLALAPEQRDVSRVSRAKVRHKGQILIDGGQLGLNLSF